jgi:hypothetical protein
VVAEQHLYDTANLILAVIGFAILWTTSIVSMTLWLSSKFRSLERMIYIEMDKHRREDDDKFQKHGDRIIRLELKNYGFAENK